MKQPEQSVPNITGHASRQQHIERVYPRLAGKSGREVQFNRAGPRRIQPFEADGVQLVAENANLISIKMGNEGLAQ
jgi:hypothetical protein